jgi:hypothetical protein
MPATAPQDVIGQIITKALGNRSPADFVPVIVPPQIKSPAELMADEPKKDSIPGIVEKFVPVDAPKVVGDIGEDIYDLLRSVTPENIAGKGSIDLPEPKGLNEILLKPHAFAAREVRMNAPPGLPPLPFPPGLKPPHELIPAPPGFSK